jgi:ElaA protein
MEFRAVHFNQLSTIELYEILQLREAVFHLEQACVYTDLDDKDLEAHHVIGIQDGKIHATSRILAPGISYDGYASIGRVCTSSIVRTQGYGKALMEKSLTTCIDLYPHNAIKISAQSYLLDFYSSFGFQAYGEEYFEDEIPHKGMIRKNE